MLYCGVDIGNRGGVAVLDAYAQVLRIDHMPIKKDMHGKVKVDPRGIYQILTWSQSITLLALEHCQSFGKKSGSSAVFSFGVNCGITSAVVQIIGIPYVQPTPQVWKAKLLAGTAKDKQAAIQYCNARWPGACKNHDGLADALLLAEYARVISKGK